MSNSSSVIPGAKSLASIPVVLSKPARQRLKWFDYYRSHGNNARRTCRYFGISPQTFYRWKRRYNPYHLESLEDRSHRPKRLRQPTASPELVVAVLKLREKYPRWGKDKLVVLLREEGYLVSNSIVGRTIRRLKDSGVLREPIKNPLPIDGVLDGPTQFVSPKVMRFPSLVIWFSLIPWISGLCLG